MASLSNGAVRSQQSSTGTWSLEKDAVAPFNAKRVIVPTTKNTATRTRLGSSTSSDPSLQLPLPLQLPLQLPPEDPLKRMDIILKKRLSGITLEQYDNLWNEQPTTTNTTSGNHQLYSYRTWLESTGKKDITIQDWISLHDDHDDDQDPNTTTASTATSTSSWNDNGDESYSMQRIVTFTVARTSHLYIGPPTASVRHVQRRRLDHYNNDNDGINNTTNNTTTTRRRRSVMIMQVTMSGIPFGDCFQVYIKWVATQMSHNNEKDLDIQVGVHVHFVKSTMYVTIIQMQC
jgi:VAD1 Analog of StAR-related lipid transfer domain